MMIVVDNLSKTYRIRDVEVPALKGIGFRVEAGEILGFVGRSGGGKSTLLKILRGIEDFDSGRIVMGDLTIVPDSDPAIKAEQRRITAIHLQRDFGLWTESALKNVVRRVNSRVTGYEVLPIEEDATYEEMYDEAMGYLRVVGLASKANHLATLLSGGEKQRLLIARQLAKKPQILLLDEPATMACPTTKQEVMDTILKVNKELGLTILVVSHLPEVHRYLANRLIWLDRGSIKAVGDTDEVLESFLSCMGPSDPLPERPDPPKPEIVVEGLSKRNYLVGTGEVLRIKDLTFSINEGEITSLIGSSGGGKTTLLKIMQGLKPPDEGTVLYRHGDDWVDMTSYSKLRKEVRRKIGIMYQEFALMPGETILEQIGYQLGVKGPEVLGHARKVAEEMNISDRVLDMLYTVADMQKEEAEAVLNKLGLTREVVLELFPRFPASDALEYAQPIMELMDLDSNVLDKLPEQLSGGEKVRATLAMLLAANPSILILDEPFGDIDPITLREVSNAIKRVNAKGCTILLVSHHVDFVREISHRAMLMEKGAIIMDGSPEEVCQAFLSRCDCTYLHGARGAKRPAPVEG